MKRFILSVAAVALGLVLVGAADAGGKGSSHGGVSKGQSRPYHELHGTKFKGGYFYKGKDHRHWTYRYWWGKYGCYTYYCPSTSCWYYWYPQDNCYYPCSYISSATPVAQPAPLGVETSVKQIVNVTNNSPGAVTGGVVPPPPDREAIPATIPAHQLAGRDVGIRQDCSLEAVSEA